MIKQNLQEIRDKIEIAAKKSGRQASDIMLIGVTKTIGVERIEELLDEGIYDIGENRVQELLGKYEQLGDKPNWHMIGRLQTNKVKYIIDKVSLIHSVDSLRLAEEINKRASYSNIVKNILIEVNVANEQTKAGISSTDLANFIQNLLPLNNICVKGLMTVAPLVENSEQNRDCFRKMMKLFLDINANFSDNICMKYLSMGMTNDFEIAIEEGANIVRIGNGIFGARRYT